MSGRQHFRNAAWGGFSAASKAVYGVLNALLALRLLGLEHYGLLATLFSIFALYLSLNTSVFTMLVVKLMSAAGDTDRSRALTGAATLAWSGGLVMLGLGGVTACLIWGQHDVAADGMPINVVLLLMAGMTALQITSTLQSALLESDGHLHVAMKLQMVSPLFVVAGLLGCFLLSIPLSPEGYLALLSVGALLDLGLLWRARRVRVIRDYAGLFSAESINALKDIFKTAGLLQGASMMNLFLEPLNKLLLNHFLGSAAVSIYDLVMKVVWGIQNLFSAAMRVFLHIGSQQSDSLGDAFAQVLRLVSVPVLLMHVAGVLFLSIVSRYWLHIPVDELLPFFGIATLSNLAMILVTPLYIALIGRQALGFIFRIQATLAVANLLLSLVMIPKLGLLGAALGLLVATLYNAISILWECRNDVIRAEALPAALRGLARRYAVGIAVWCGAMGWGWGADANWPWLVALVTLLVFLSAREPLVHRMLQRIYPTGRIVG